MVEWNPRSLLGQAWTRPRVYLIDLETAVQFSDGVDSSNRVCSGLPLPFEDYARPKAPELMVPEPSVYYPFRLDAWQFGFNLVQMLSVRKSPLITTRCLANMDPCRRQGSRRLTLCGFLWHLTTPRTERLLPKCCKSSVTFLPGFLLGFYKEHIPALPCIYEYLRLCTWMKWCLLVLLK